MNKKKSLLESLWVDIIKPWGEAILFAWVITTFLISMVGVSGDSMLPNLRTGERIFIPKYETWLHRFGVGNFSRGDVVVFKPPATAPNSTVSVFGVWEYRAFFIKRVVGLPGDKVRIEKGEVFVNGQKVNQAGITDYWQKQGCWDDSSPLARQVAPDGSAEITVPAKSYFVMGDNRTANGSEDSRMIGVIPIENIAGRATVVVWPFVRKTETVWDCNAGFSMDSNPVTLTGDTVLNFRLVPRLDGFDNIK